jgi:hypothetical protein
MTEPDDALLWARERCASTFVVADCRPFILQGEQDAYPNVRFRAEGFRAGHAARDAEVAAKDAEIERLRAALEEIAKPDYGYMDIIEAGYPAEKHADYFAHMVGWRRRTARAALKETPDGE